ncbi:similar to Saccharomyces cerevisiae YDR118W APC4 Subunit of the Anaphase-Promoting Complex/Cyclosome (APC/C) [Maudiozyma saulgeensis]|uniref:Similar to Saccharomyces cerevisiae YDR118W APC4 Subunit of the Anaphase-Promoting Complex/Cyclosome (APC/C) n=1 Tax=Maudiozyma saulgeensis TaxID=1789683 RepID=A0A1X7R699_9SACH|nr:similar to Saccharomyces cerevisiae YDR118W APC4 Subunit of the Anaphase-Promoting Complex/Cyclosome (APC/C) [Kazachstania saulgeensis]
MSEEEFYRIENPEQNLYLTRQGKSIVVKRRSDDEQISSTYIRDWSQLIGCHWDTILGQYLSITFIDGSIRLIDTNDNGKLISFMRTGLVGADGSYWSRLYEENKFKNNTPVINISKSLPILTKFSMDKETLKFEPFDLISKQWRKVNDGLVNWGNKEENKRGILDVHIMHCESNDEVAFVLNGTLTLMKLNEEAKIRQICKITSEESGIYQFWYRDGKKRDINISSILTNDNNMYLLHDIIEFQELVQYLKTSITFLHDKIIKPYTSFLEKVTKISYDDNQKLFDDLNQLIFTGEVEESLSEWLKYTIGERNIQTWRDQSSKMYENGTEILQLGVINALERVFISLERITGSLILLHTNTNSNEDEQMQFELQISKIYEKFKIMFTTTTEVICNNNKTRRMLKQFLNWLEDKVQEINETDNDNNDNDNKSNGHKTQNLDYFDEATTVSHIKEGLKQVCFWSTIKDKFLFMSDDFTIMLNEIDEIVNKEIINKFIIPKFESLLIEKGYETIFSTLEQNNNTSFELLDIEPMEIIVTPTSLKNSMGLSTNFIDIIVYKKITQDHTEQIVIGTIDGPFIPLILPEACQVQMAHLTSTQLYKHQINGINKRFNLVIKLSTSRDTIEYLQYIFEVRQHSRGKHNTNVGIGMSHHISENNASRTRYATDWFIKNFAIEQIYPALTTTETSENGNPI